MNKSGITMSSELRFNPYYDGTEQDAAGNITLSNVQWNEALLMINSLKKGRKQFIVCEERQIWGHLLMGLHRIIGL